MKKTKAMPPPTVETDWTVSYEYTLVRNVYTKTLVVGTEISILGERGRFRFMKHVSRPNGVEWIDVWGGPKGSECIRSFRPERIKRVHTKGTTDKAILAQRAVAKENA